MFFDQGLCLFHTKPENQEQLFRSMYKELYQAGCVKASYIDGITARESEYPTGLEFNGVGFASLDEPVIFQDMTDKNHDIEVNLVFMLAMASPHEQVETLQNLMTLFTEEEKVKKLQELSSQEEFIKLLSDSGVY